MAGVAALAVPAAAFFVTDWMAAVRRTSEISC